MPNRRCIKRVEPSWKRPRRDWKPFMISCSLMHGGKGLLLRYRYTIEIKIWIYHTYCKSFGNCLSCQATIVSIFIRENQLRNQKWLISRHDYIVTNEPSVLKIGRHAKDWAKYLVLTQLPLYNRPEIRNYGQRRFCTWYAHKYTTNVVSTHIWSYKPCTNAYK